MIRQVLFAVVAVVLATAVPAAADVPEGHVFIGVTGGGVFPLTDWALGSKAVEDSFQAETSPQAGVRVGYQVTSQFGFEFEGQHLWLQNPTSEWDSAFSYSGDLFYHFMRGDWSPFIIGGAGGYQNYGLILGEDGDFQFHLGLGVRGMLTEWLALRFEARDVVTNGFGDPKSLVGNNLEVSAGLDLFPLIASAPADKDKDQVIDEKDRCPTLAGVASAEGCPDQDGDAVEDKQDACPGDYGPATTQGCPDQDADGVADRDDACRQQPGKADMRGCPDLDGDRIADGDDACPDQAGKSATRGCPDQDSDGLADADDACAAEAGKAETKGCPDKDGDLVADKDDACPAEAGKPALKGCPDQDGDTVPDQSDKCPTVRGLVEHEGCLPKEVEKFTGKIEGINFASGKAVLLPSSFKVLDQTVAILQKYPSMRIRIEGHTDNTGDAEANKKLSGERAEAVRKYLLDKGVAQERLQAEGFGSEKPLADNKTAKGRAQNRRVEFNLIEQ